MLNSRFKVFYAVAVFAFNRLVCGNENNILVPKCVCYDCGGVGESVASVEDNDALVFFPVYTV